MRAPSLIQPGSSDVNADLTLVHAGQVNQAGAIVEVPQFDAPVFQARDQPPLGCIERHRGDFHGLALRSGELHGLLPDHDVPNSDLATVATAHHLQ